MDGEGGHHVILGSSELAWVDGEVQGDEVERLGRGSGSGGNYGDQRRGTRSAIAGESEGDEGESERG